MKTQRNVIGPVAGCNVGNRAAAGDAKRARYPNGADRTGIRAQQVHGNRFGGAGWQGAARQRLRLRADCLAVSADVSKTSD